VRATVISLSASRATLCFWAAFVRPWCAKTLDEDGFPGVDAVDLSPAAAVEVDSRARQLFAELLADRLEDQ
jgi:hypothetical protein